MLTYSKAGKLESSANTAYRAPCLWPHCPLGFICLATVQRGLADQQGPVFPLPGPGAPLSLEHPAGVCVCTTGPGLYTVGLQVLHGQLLTLSQSSQGVKL